MPGSEYSRCISLESSGLPEAVRLPAMAQALEPGCGSAAGARGKQEIDLAAGRLPPACCA